jgi:hypothetical protein
LSPYSVGRSWPFGARQRGVALQVQVAGLRVVGEILRGLARLVHRVVHADLVRHLLHLQRDARGGVAGALRGAAGSCICWPPICSRVRAARTLTGA